MRGPPSPMAWIGTFPVIAAAERVVWRGQTTRTQDSARSSTAAVAPPVDTYRLRRTLSSNSCMLHGEGSGTDAFDAVIGLELLLVGLVNRRG